jgi:WD40 repeat protein
MPGRVFALRFNKEGDWFAAGSSLDGKGELRIYQTADGKLVSKLDTIGPVYTIAVRPDGKEVAAAGFDGKVHFCDPATGKELRQFVPVPLTNSPDKVTR